MKKFSRMYGMMELVGYVSGDGSVGFHWTVLGKGGDPLPELVTESDVSEWLLNPDVAAGWDGWDILNLGAGWHPRIVLAQDVFRPCRTSRKLVTGGKTYRYVFDQRMEDSMGAGFHHDERTTAFYEGRSQKIVENSTITTALCFFLNHEEAYCRRNNQRAQCGVPLGHRAR